METTSFRNIENLKVYSLLCDLHLEVWEVTKNWPKEERFELTSQVLRSSNSSPAQLAEKNEDRHIRNRIEGVNRARGEAGETLHHLRIATRKEYISEKAFQYFKGAYYECIRMLNGLERNLEGHIPDSQRTWVREPPPDYTVDVPAGFPASDPS